MDPANAAATATADDSHDDRNIEAKNINENKSKQKTSLIFNYSGLILSEAMKNLLNRALNFAVLPLKMDITQLLVDFNRFARALIWQEYWHGRDSDEEYTKPIFKTRKKKTP